LGPLIPDGKIDQEAIVAWKECQKQVEKEHGMFASNRPFRECMKEKGYLVKES